MKEHKHERAQANLKERLLPAEEGEVIDGTYCDPCDEVVSSGWIRDRSKAISALANLGIQCKCSLTVCATGTLSSVRSRLPADCRCPLLLPQTTLRSSRSSSS